MRSDTEDVVRTGSERKSTVIALAGRSRAAEGQKEARTCFVPLIHVEAVTIQFHDDNQRCKSRLQYRNPSRPRTRYRGVVLDSFRYIRSAFGTGVRVGILLPPLITSNIAGLAANSNRAIDG